MNPKGLAAIVTGGGSGLGAASAAKLASEGAKVAIFDLNEETGKKQAAEVGGKFYKVNVTDQASVVEAIAEGWLAGAIAAFGQTKRLMHAGLGRPFREALDDEARTIGAAFETSDAQRAVAAFAAASTHR